MKTGLVWGGRRGGVVTWVQPASTRQANSCCSRKLHRALTPSLAFLPLSSRDDGDDGDDNDDNEVCVCVCVLWRGFWVGAVGGGALGAVCVLQEGELMEQGGLHVRL